MKKFILILICLLPMLFLQVSESEKSNIIDDINKKDTFIEFGYVNIPKINLNTMFYNNNNLDNNVIVVKPSQYPDVENSLLILAGHSGRGHSAYFNNLYKLKEKDNIFITYNNKKYKYVIIDIYYQKKDGNIDIYKLKNTNTLVLITCTNNKKNLQTVFVSKLVK